MRPGTLLVAALVASATSPCAQGAGDSYACPHLAQDRKPAERATGVDVYSGHPSGKGHLRPDNDDNGPNYWILGSPDFEYWYVCQYRKRGEQRELKLDRTYARCTELRAGKYFDRLECKD